MRFEIYNIIPPYKYFIIDDKYYMARNLKNLIALYKGEIKPDGFFEKITDDKNILMCAIRRDKTNMIFEKDVYEFMD